MISCEILISDQSSTATCYCLIDRIGSCSESAQTPFSHGLAQATAHSPKLISHIKKLRDQTSVLLSVMPMRVNRGHLESKPNELKKDYRLMKFEIKVEVNLFN